ncbi:MULTISPECIES: F0F1 ATP synthase subunit epsilon [Thalassoglobus]|uniref:F0F1 ATP synthase subunit epsilon n=1 Tax=Thalassoglobus polymorphus TaxID=2527994 RepID=A0A517QK13_9PLAN|nr:F0F1 ATP synthase subunit epsilon [Thalassoglobus polymorphus]QDT31979.1 F0F1 ATP synthase subunit epsilon [Thalassoglobus polymorphus]
MILKVLLPTSILLDETVTKVVAEGQNGLFCLLPKHVDFVSALVPGILTFQTEDQVEQYLAVGEGILVKTDSIIRVSTRHAVRGTDLGQLRQKVKYEFESLDDRERAARTAIAQLEVDFARRFLQLKERSHV